MLRFGVLVFMGVQTIPSMLRFGCLFLWATVHLKSPCRPAQTIPSMLRFGVLVFMGHCPSQIIMSSSSNHTVHAEVWGACFHGSSNHTVHAEVWGACFHGPLSISNHHVVQL